MSFLHGKNTKKVTTYGKKRTSPCKAIWYDAEPTQQIIAVHTDFSPVSARSPPLPTEATNSSPVAKRAPLTAKRTQDVEGCKPTTLKAVKPYFDGVDKTPAASPPVKATGQPKTRNPTRARVIVPRISPVQRPLRRKEYIDAVVIPVSRPAAKKPIRHSSSDLADRFAAVSLNSSEQPATAAFDPIKTHSHIDGLLKACSFLRPQPFEGFLSSPNFLFHTFSCRSFKDPPAIRKIGEASYSEVFAVSVVGRGDVVIKIIPLMSENASPAQTSGGVELPDTSTVEDVVREIEVTKRMAQAPQGGFVDYLGTFVVQGAYPAGLLDEWDEFKATLGSSSIRPDAFAPSQYYAIIVLTHGGPDLESFKFDTNTGWVQAAGVFWQTAAALARAEEWTNFEHRDLHEGQVLITTCAIDHESTVDYLASSSTGIKTTIIDFGLSRLNVGRQAGDTASTSLPEEVFEGRGEQWDVYRSMREIVGQDWSGYYPITNVLWLNYLLRYILHPKLIRKPRLPTKMSRPSGTSPLRPTRRVAAATGATRKVKAVKDERVLPNLKAHEMMLHVDKVLGALLKGQRGRGGVDAGVEFRSAGEVVAWGREMGWLGYDT